MSAKDTRFASSYWAAFFDGILECFNLGTTEVTYDYPSAATELEDWNRVAEDLWAIMRT